MERSPQRHASRAARITPLRALFVLAAATAGPVRHPTVKDDGRRFDLCLHEVYVKDRFRTTRWRPDETSSEAAARTLAAGGDDALDDARIGHIARFLEHRASMVAAPARALALAFEDGASLSRGQHLSARRENLPSSPPRATFAMMRISGRGARRRRENPSSRPSLPQERQPSR